MMMNEAANGKVIENSDLSIELNYPLDKEAWKAIEDAELDNTKHIYFITPSGERVDFVKADAANDEWLERIDKIRAEIDKLEVLKFSSGERIYKDEVLDIIDKYR